MGQYNVLARDQSWRGNRSLMSRLHSRILLQQYVIDIVFEHLHLPAVMIFHSVLFVILQKYEKSH